MRKACYELNNGIASVAERLFSELVDDLDKLDQVEFGVLHARSTSNLGLSKIYGNKIAEGVELIEKAYHKYPERKNFIRTYGYALF